MGKITEQERQLRNIKSKEQFIACMDYMNLTDRQREIFVLKYNRGWSNIKISMELEISEATVYRELSVIRRRLP